MTSRERIINALEGRPVDHLPFSPFLAYIWEYFPKSIQDMGQPAFLKEIGADPMWRGTPCPVTQFAPGVTFDIRETATETVTEIGTPVGSIRQVYRKSVEGNTAFLIEHPLKTEEDFKIQLWIEEHSRLEMCDQTPVLDCVNMDGLAIGILIPRAKTAFQSLVEHHVGTEELVYALYDYPDTVEALISAMVENDLKAAEMAADSAYTYFITWEDSSTQNYSPALYDRYIAPEISRFCGILDLREKRYAQHACGHVRDLLKSMREGGVKAVESLSSPPTGNVGIREARELLGSSVGIIGGIEPTAFLNLSMEELEPYVEQVISDASGGPFVLGNSDSCPPGVSVEKFKLVSRIAKRTRP
jgi:uroporphyrinogen-III decarboxylase